MVIFLILLSSIFITENTARRYTMKDLSGVHSYIQPYVEKFEQDFNVKVENVTLTFFVSSTVNPILAYCNSNFQQRFVMFDYEAWIIADYYQREELVYHELGHCVLDLEHDNSIVEIDGHWASKSIMYQYKRPDNYYESHRDYYINEMKNKKLEKDNSKNINFQMEGIL